MQPHFLCWPCEWGRTLELTWWFDIWYGVGDSERGHREIILKSWGHYLSDCVGRDNPKYIWLHDSGRAYIHTHIGMNPKLDCTVYTNIFYFFFFQTYSHIKPIVKFIGVSTKSLPKKFGLKISDDLYHDYMGCLLKFSVLNPTQTYPVSTFWEYSLRSCILATSSVGSFAPERLRITS